MTGPCHSRTALTMLKQSRKEMRDERTVSFCCKLVRSDRPPPLAAGHAGRRRGWAWNGACGSCSGTGDRAVVAGSKRFDVVDVLQYPCAVDLD